MGAPGRSGSPLDRARTLSGRSPEAKWRRLGSQAGRLGRHVGHRGHQVGSPRRSKRRPGPAQRPLRTRALSRTAFEAIFRRFFMRWWNVRTSIFVSQCSVLYTSDEVRTERAQAAKQHENRGFSASKIKPGSLEIELGRLPASAKPRSNLRSLFEFLKMGPNEQDRARKVTREVRFGAPVRRRISEISGAPYGFIRKDISILSKIPIGCAGALGARRLNRASNRSPRVSFLALSRLVGPIFKISMILRRFLRGFALAGGRPSSISRLPGSILEAEKPLIFVLFRRLRTFGANFVRSVQNIALIDEN